MCVCVWEGGGGGVAFRMSRRNYEPPRTCPTFVKSHFDFEHSRKCIKYVYACCLARDSLTQAMCVVVLVHLDKTHGVM